MGFSKRKHITAAWPPLAASIKMLELSYGTMKKKCDIFLYTNLVHMYQNCYLLICQTSSCSRRDIRQEIIDNRCYRSKVNLVICSSHL